MQRGSTEMSAKMGDPGRARRPLWFVWAAVVFGGIILLMQFNERANSWGEPISQYRFGELVDSDQILQATINYDPQCPLNEVVGKYAKIQTGVKRRCRFAPGYG